MLLARPPGAGLGAPRSRGAPGVTPELTAQVAHRLSEAGLELVHEGEQAELQLKVERDEGRLLLRALDARPVARGDVSLAEASALEVELELAQKLATLAQQGAEVLATRTFEQIPSAAPVATEQVRPEEHVPATEHVRPEELVLPPPAPLAAPPHAAPARIEVLAGFGVAYRGAWDPAGRPLSGLRSAGGMWP